MKKILITTLFLLALLVAGYYIYTDYFVSKLTQAEPLAVEAVIPPPEPTDRIEQVTISDGDTFGALMATSGIPYAEAMDIYDAARDVYDLVKIRVGRIIELVFDKDTDDFKELRYKVDTEDELFITKSVATTTASSSPVSAPDWQAAIKPIPYVVEVVTATGTVETSMYEAAIEKDIDIRAIIDLANVFQWSIDFAMDPRQGDTFSFVYEKRYLNGEYVMPGRILAGRYVNNGTPFEAYYFEESADNTGYFDEDGNSVQKMFLKAPVEFRYISSGYTTGNRVVMEIGLSGPHRAIDYAAPLGTPIRAVGDGTVTFAGWNSHGYGNLTSIRHNATYSTNYAHQSKIIVKVGQKVKQGDIIGYVGSTGYSTGPHVHFEMVKNGAKINPLTEIQPPGKPILEENRDRFFTEIDKWQDMLNL